MSNLSQSDFELFVNYIYAKIMIVLMININFLGIIVIWVCNHLDAA